jgi:glycosyltransferase involved in cell wall biosynthesis
MTHSSVKIIIPALNEEQAIGGVVRSVIDRVDEVIVADNGSRDRTALVAQNAGATVVSVLEAGYGRACLAGIAAAGACDIIVFMDGDAADDAADLKALLEPIKSGEAAFVLGSRFTGDVEKGALTLPQRFGNSLACFLMRLFWGSRFTDLGPFRAITKRALDSLSMEAPTFGWTVEMQARILKQNIPYAEVPVRYRNRIGTSKISGTVKGVILAGWYILTTIFIEAMKPRRKNLFAKTTLRKEWYGRAE